MVSKRFVGSYDHREYRPCPELSRHVDAYYVSGCRTRAQGRPLPGGMPNVFFHQGRTSLVSHGGTRTFRDGCYLVGPTTRLVRYMTPARMDMVGVRFKPGKAFELLGLAGEAFADESVPLRESGSACLKEVESRMTDAPTAERRVQILEEMLLRRLAAIPSGSDSRPALAAVERIVSGHGKMNPGGLSEEIGISAQHLRRLFSRFVGFAPKTLARLCRFRWVAEHIDRTQKPDWQDLVFDGGFYDQSHMIKEFHAIAGIVPGKFHLLG